MNLNEYLTKNRITSERFARTMKVSISAVSKWRIKNRMPRPAMLAKIQKTTRGRVRPVDWY